VTGVGVEWEPPPGPGHHRFIFFLT
jgi:hypothetical protein